MLYDPKWDGGGRDPRDLNTLIAWLETKNPTETYYYSSPSNCLLAQYYRAMGFQCVSVRPRSLFYSIGEYGFKERLPAGFDDIAIGNCRKTDCTFGAALERAKAYSNAGPVLRLRDRLAAFFGL